MGLEVQMGCDGVATAVKPLGVVLGVRGSRDPLHQAERGKEGCLDPCCQQGCASPREAHVWV